MNKIRDIKKFRGGLNTDDNPGSLPPEDYTFAKNIRSLSSDEQHGAGLAETLQAEVELILGVVAEITYYGEAIGGNFQYTGYEEVTIGTQTWMKKNYDAQYPGSKAYDDDETNVPLYGRLYTHHQVMSSNFCPPGWRVPTEADIDILLTYLGGAMIAGGKMKEAGEQDWTTPNTGAVDSAGFRALPGGKFDLLFDLLGDNCLLWLQDEAVPVEPAALAATETDVTSFLANWEAVIGADGYYLDVATDAIFTAFVAGFNNLDVGKVLSYPVTGLGALTPYYYRLRAYNEIGSSGNSNTITKTTLDGVVDADGNVYTYVTIGTQQWMVENFRSTKYADGTAIPNLTASEFTDWFLPSKDELQEMYNELKAHGVGNFAAASYCSSSEVDINLCWRLESAEVACTVGMKGNGYHVKPIRAFTSLSSYSLRDVGPAGGLVFWKSGNDYLEASLVDASDSQGFSDPLFPYILIGTTGTAIGTGQSNTTNIINAEGTVYSAAKLCDDLSSGGWINDTTGAYCAYDNDVANVADYGLLYNWYAVDNAHGLAPAGWRVPSKTDFDNLITFLGGSLVAANKLKEIGLAYWDSPNNATNDYGFNGRGSGLRSYAGSFTNLNISGLFWSSTLQNIVSSWRFLLQYEDAIVDGDNYLLGFSVRMMRDTP